MSFDTKTRDAILHLLALGFTLGAPSQTTTTASAVGTTTVPRPEHYKCGVCGETGHNSRGCPRKPATATAPATPSGVGLAPAQARKSVAPPALGGLDDLDFGDMVSPAAPKTSTPSKPAAASPNAKPTPVKSTAPAPVAVPALDSLDGLDFGDFGTTAASVVDLPTLDDAPAAGEASDSEVESELLELGDLDSADLASVLG